MKLTPLGIFIILLIFLFILLFFNKYFLLDNENKREEEEEGFISFSKDIPNQKYITIPQYSTSSDTLTIKLWDNLSFDLNNGNIIEIDGTTMGGNTTADNLGLSIDGIYIIQRNGQYNKNEYMTSLSCNGNTYSGSISTNNNLITGNSAPLTASSCSVVPTITKESQNYTLYKTTNLTAWYYNTQSTQTDKYVVLYLPFDILTFVHVINVTTNKNVITYGFAGNEIIGSSPYNITDTINISQTPDSNLDNNNGKMALDSRYDPINTVFQISHTVKIDPTNGYLIVNPSTPAKFGSYTVYDRLGRVVDDYNNKPNTVMMVNFNTWIVSDGAGNMVLYIPADLLTVVVIIAYDTSNSSYKIRDICYIGNYKKQIYAVTPENNNPPVDLSKYMLKTEYVPNISPTCGNCENNVGVCSSCGGHGGNGNTNINASNVAGGVADGVGDIVGGVATGLGTAVGGVADGVGDVAGGVATGLGTAVGGVGSGVGSVIGGALATNPANVKYINSSTQPNNTPVQNTTAPATAPAPATTPVQNTTPPPINNTGTIAGIDTYSYYGALVPKGGETDFMPVTTSFSSFGK